MIQRRKINFYFLSSIATMVATIQGENKQKQKYKSEDKRKQENGQT